MHLINLYSKFDYSTNSESGINIAFYIKKNQLLNKLSN